MSSISKVYFGSILQSKDHSFASMVVKEGKMVGLMDFSTVDKGDKVARRGPLTAGDNADGTAETGLRATTLS